MGNRQPSQPLRRIEAASELPRVQCAGCGASVPILTDVDVRCPYCAAEVEVSEAVRQTYREHALVVSDMRTEGIRAVERLKISPDGLTLTVTILKTAWVVAASAWLAFVIKSRSIEVSTWEGLLACSIVLGPITFFLVRREKLIDDAIVAASQLKMAQLVPEADKFGTVHLAIACSSCGALFKDATVHGLSMDCPHCGAKSLAPSVLVRTSEQKFLRVLMSHRDDTENAMVRVPYAPMISGALFLIGFFVVAAHCRDLDSPMHLGISAISLPSVAMALAWVMTYEIESDVMRGYVFVSFVLGPLVVAVALLLNL